MRALRYYGREDVRLEEVPQPVLERPEDAIVRVTTTSVCGTDLHPYRGTRYKPEGALLGHEAVGLVESVGASVKHVKPGDRVLVPSVIGCGFCAYCTQGVGSQCQAPGAGTLQGAQAEFVRVPWANASLVRLPDGLTDEAALTLADAFPSGYFGVQQAEVRPGNAVAIFGAGPVGLFAMKAAQMAGATRIYAVDHDLDRLDLAAREGFHPLDLMGEPPVQAILALTGGHGVDAAIEAVGMDAINPDGERDPGVAARWCLEAVKPAGRVAILGAFSQPIDAFPLHLALERNVSIRGGVANVRTLVQPLLAMLQQGRFDPTFVYTGAIDFEDIEHGYRQFDRHEHIKVIVRTEAGREQMDKKSARFGVTRVSWT
ncbi:Formaldehyde dismutase [compost metagenome]